jgi:hypothetical protein
MGTAGQERSVQRKQHAGMVRWRPKVKHESKRTEMKEKAYLTRSTGGTECTGYTRLGGQESGVDSGCRTGAVQRAFCGLESSERLRGR